MQASGSILLTRLHPLQTRIDTAAVDIIRALGSMLSKNVVVF